MLPAMSSKSAAAAPEAAVPEDAEEEKDEELVEDTGAMYEPFDAEAYRRRLEGIARGGDST